MDTEDVHGEDGINDAEALLFHKGGESLMSIDEVLAALLGQEIKGRAEHRDGGDTFFDKAGAAFGG